MAKRDRNPKPAARRVEWQIPIFFLIAFGLGAATSWLVMRGSSNMAPKPAIESFLPSAGLRASTSQAAAPAAVEPPNVSQLTPADAARTLGNWNYDRENWSQAIQQYEQAIARGADTPDVRTDLGNCFRFVGKPQKALEQYRVAQKEDPQHENSLFNEISLFDDLLHDKQRAQSAARDFLARFPQSPRAAVARRRLDELQQNLGSDSSPR